MHDPDLGRETFDHLCIDRAPESLDCPLHAASVNTDEPAARDILATHARTSFNLATRFLPEEQRVATTILYAFFRTLDDIVDKALAPDQTIEARDLLHQWRGWLGTSVSSSSPELAEAVLEIADRYQIPPSVFHDFIDGLLNDLRRQKIETDRELACYCYQVASTVGIAMAHVLGATSPEALRGAELLGNAMQRTNILRDIGEDLRLGRVYIPSRTLATAGLRRSDLFAMRGNPDRVRRDVAPLIHAEVRRTRIIYAQAMPAIWLLPPASRFSILLAARLYRRLLVRIEQVGYDTINYEARTTRRDKAAEIIVSGVLVKLWNSAGPITDG